MIGFCTRFSYRHGRLWFGPVIPASLAAGRLFPLWTGAGGPAPLAGQTSAKLHCPGLIIPIALQDAPCCLAIRAPRRPSSSHKDHLKIPLKTCVYMFFGPLAPLRSRGTETFLSSGSFSFPHHAICSHFTGIHDPRRRTHPAAGHSAPRQSADAVLRRHALPKGVCFLWKHGPGNGTGRSLPVPRVRCRV